MEELYRLPDGTWIVPSEVCEISPHEKSEFSDYPPSLVIKRGKICIQLRFESYAAAKEYGDSLATVVNDARRPQKALPAIECL